MDSDDEDDEYFESEKSESSIKLEPEDTQEHDDESCTCVRKCPLTCGLILLALGLLVYIAIIICTLQFKTVQEEGHRSIYDFYYADYQYDPDNIAVDENEASDTDEDQLDPNEKKNRTTKTDNSKTPLNSGQSQKDNIGGGNKYIIHEGSSIIKKTNKDYTYQNKKSPATRLEECIKNARF